MDSYGNILLNLQNVFICLTMRGILQMVKLESSIAQHLSLTMLNKMVSYIDFDHSIQVAAWAAIVLGFHLLLCKSNLVLNSVAEFKSAQQLQCHNIHFDCGMALVNIKWSKTRRIGKLSDNASVERQRSSMSSCHLKEAISTGPSLTI